MRDRIVLLAPLVLFGGMGLLLTTDATRGFAMRMSRENGPIELATALLLLVGAVCGIRLTWRVGRAGGGRLAVGFVVLFSLGLFVVGMEEIAWGQKLIGYQTPALFQQVNQQHEVTLHNLPGLHGHSDLMWAGFALCGLFGMALHRWEPARLIAPEPTLASWLLIIAGVGLMMAYRDIVDADNRFFTLLRRMDEFIELLIAMVSCLYLWQTARRVSSTGHEVEPS
ncbi:MAG: hypothetical protein Kow00105_18610 [Phycisphaeraceae bacterium]